MTVDFQPLLVGELVKPRPLRPDDWNALFAVASDPEIWAQHPARDRWQEPVFRDFFDKATQSGGAFVVLECATGETIGSTRYANHDSDRSAIEIGWTFLARRCWGGRYNSEMKRPDYMLARRA